VASPRSFAASIGWRQHQEGEIEVEGITLDGSLKNLEDIRSNVGMVFQQFNLFPHMTVLENCTLSPIWVQQKPKAEAEKLARELLARVRIPDQA
jgi:general L-amino acid transport system ATP-binding protein